MLPSWLRPAPLIDAPSRDWLFALYEWAIPAFDPRFFVRNTPLVTPTDRDFPGHANGTEAMANLIFEHVRRHAGLSHWPLSLLHPGQDPQAPQPLEQRPAVNPGDQRHTGAIPPPARLAYPAGRLANPEALIGTLARALADLLARTADGPPPGGPENWPQSTEVLAVFLGFGVIMANSAYESPRVACGSCRVPGSERESDLSRYDLTYALAIFLALKQLPASAATPHLKRPLRGYLRRALREARRDPRLARLQELTQGPALPGS